MKLAEVPTRLSQIGIPVVYDHWEAVPGEVHDPPFICWRDSARDNFFADGKVWQSAHRIIIELYTAMKDPALEALVEAALDDVAWVSGEATYIEAEHCYMQYFEFEVI